MGKLCNCGKNQWGLVRHWEYERMGMGKIFCRTACKVEYLKRKQQAQNIEAYQESKPPGSRAIVFTLNSLLNVPPASGARPHGNA